MNLAVMFRHAHTALGASALTAIGAVATWTAIPSGYTYDPTTDRLVNTSGTVLTVTPTHYAGKTTVIDYVPTGFSLEMRQMIAAGLVPNGTMDVIVKIADVAAMRAAWRVKVGANYYRMSDVNESIPGAAQVARVRLVRTDA